MYKRFSIQELETVKNNFIQNLYNIIRKEKCQGFSDYAKILFNDGDDVYHFFRGTPMFRFSKQGNTIKLIDEKEKIEVVIDADKKSQIQNLVKHFIMKRGRQKDQKSIETILGEAFLNGDFNTIHDKPYLIYDIETTTESDIKNSKFLLAYYMQIGADNKAEYHYVAKEDLKNFVQKMLDFDGYIVGFNSIAFDNPVSILNVGLGEKEIEILNKKSIDLFLFIRNMTGKRIGLNKISESLFGIGKTLESGKEGEVLYNKYKETGDIKFLNEFKNYCKNDVKMTVLVCFYLLYYKKIFIENQEITYTLEAFFKNAQKIHKEENTNNESQQQSMF